jgi:hypothetical protein
MQGQPKLAIAEFAGQRRAMWDAIADTHVVNQIAVRRLYNELDALLAVLPFGDQSRPFVLHEQAYLCAYLLKPDASLRLFQQAEAEGLPPIAKAVSASHALYICGEIKMAIDEIERVKLDKAKHRDLEAVADQCVHLGLFGRARDLYQAAGSTGGYVERVTCAAELIEEINGNDREVSDRLAVAAEIVKKMSYHPFIGYDVFAMRGEGILFRFVVRDDIERLVDIDREIDTALSAQFEGPIDSIFSIGVYPHAVGSLKDIGVAYNVGI